MPAANYKYPWLKKWSTDEGVDGEIYWEKHDDHQRYGYAKSILKS